jgi:hypothetical protein
LRFQALAYKVLSKKEERKERNITCIAVILYASVFERPAELETRESVGGLTALAWAARKGNCATALQPLITAVSKEQVLPRRIYNE